MQQHITGNKKAYQH
jgi:hypothetical protein